MAIRLTDNEIKQFIAEKKVLPDNYKTRLRNFRPSRSGKESHIAVKGELDNDFKIILRQNTKSPLSFSVILLYEFPKSTATFRLRRYNGKHSLHTNRIENSQILNDFHIHQATERYQELGASEDAFAEKTDRYNTIWTALKCLISDCNFIIPEAERKQISMDFENEN